MAHVLHMCSFSTESKELQPFEHCVLLKQAFNAAGHHKAISWPSTKTERPLSSNPQRTSTQDPSSKRQRKRCWTPSRVDFSKLYPSPKSKDKHKFAFQASGPLADYLNAPLLDISRMHKEDNIQAIVSTPRPSLVLEEKEARDQMKRAVEFHKMFLQAAKFLSNLREGSSTQDQGSILTLAYFFVHIPCLLMLP